MIELGSEVPPDRNTVSRLPPGCQGQAEHVQDAEHGGRPHKKTREQRESNKHLHRAYRVAEKCRVWHNEMTKEPAVESDCLALDISAQVFLKSAMSEP